MYLQTIVGRSRVGFTRQFVKDGGELSDMPVYTTVLTFDRHDHMYSSAACTTAQ
jgi:hypothetical protein